MAASSRRSTRTASGSAGPPRARIMPTSAGWSGVDAGRLDRAAPGGPDLPADAADRRADRPDRRELARRRRAPRRPARAVRRARLAKRRWRSCAGVAGRNGAGRLLRGLGLRRAAQPGGDRADARTDATRRPRRSRRPRATWRFARRSKIAGTRARRLRARRRNTAGTSNARSRSPCRRAASCCAWSPTRRARLRRRDTRRSPSRPEGSLVNASRRRGSGGQRRDLEPDRRLPAARRSEGGRRARAGPGDDEQPDVRLVELHGLRDDRRRAGRVGRGPARRPCTWRCRTRSTLRSRRSRPRTRCGSSVRAACRQRRGGPPPAAMGSIAVIDGARAIEASLLSDRRRHRRAAPPAAAPGDRARTGSTNASSARRRA